MVCAVIQLVILLHNIYAYMKQQKLLLNIAMWAGLYALWVVIFKNYSLTVAKTITVEFCYLIFIAANYYLHIYYSVPRFLYQKKYLQFAIVLLGGIAVSAILRVPLAMYIGSHFFNTGKPVGFTALFLNSFLNIFVWVVCLVAAKLAIDKIRFQKYVDTIEKEKMKAELDFLKAQFNPHFLFNSINSIYGHIDKKNSSARGMLLTFSNMLRYQLYECNTETIPIEREVDFIKNYITLQQVRMEESLVIKCWVAPAVTGFSIAPLLFISFIENAFKYVSNNDDRENRVEILLDKHGNEFTCRVFNTKDVIVPKKLHQGGIGIANAKKRLELLYPQKHTLHINDAGNTFEVTLNLQLA